MFIVRDKTEYIWKILFIFYLMVKLGEIIFRRLSEIFRELHKERKEWCSGISF